MNRGVVFEAFPELELLLFLRGVKYVSFSYRVFLSVSVSVSSAMIITAKACWLQRKISLCNNSASSSLFFSLTCGCCKRAMSSPAARQINVLLLCCQCLSCPQMMSSTCVLVSFCLSVLPPFFHRYSRSFIILHVSVCIFVWLFVRLLLFVSFIKHLKPLPYKLKQVHLWFHGFFHPRIQPFPPSSHAPHF